MLTDATIYSHESRAVTTHPHQTRISSRDSRREVRRQRGHKTNTIFTIQVAPHKVIDSLHTLILTSSLLRSSSMWWRRKETQLGLIFSKIELYKINTRNEMLKHLKLRHKTHPEGWKNKWRGLIWWATIPHMKGWWWVVNVARGWIAMIP